MNAQLPPHPHLQQLRKQAKEFLRALRKGDVEALERLAQHAPRTPGHAPALADAQLVIAREYGFASWPKMKRHLEGLEKVEGEVEALRRAFAEASPQEREPLLEPLHSRHRLRDYQPGDAHLSERDARLIIANREGYALWSKYESHLHLNPEVRDLLQAIRRGDLQQVKEVIKEDPGAANPRWMSGYQPWESPEQPRIPNDSVPLFGLCEAVFRGALSQAQAAAMARLLLEAGADPDLAWRPMEGAVSFNCPGVTQALLDHGASVEGPAPGVWMAYPMLFGFTQVCEVLAAAGARLDLRFAAGLGRLEEMEQWFTAEGSLKPDPGLADPHASSRASRGESALRAERTPQVVLGQALLYACLHGRLEAAEFLLGRGADPSALILGTDVDATALHRVCWLDHFGATLRKERIEEQRLPIAKFLLERGADLAVRDRTHNATPLGWARACGAQRLAALLQERGAKE